MRPQHITAENVIAFRPGPERDLASMRPQHITAENRDHDRSDAGRHAASMRPQHITAENTLFLRGAGGLSMLQ